MLDVIPDGHGQTIYNPFEQAGIKPILAIARACANKHKLSIDKIYYGSKDLTPAIKLLWPGMPFFHYTEEEECLSTAAQIYKTTKDKILNSPRSKAALYFEYLVATSDQTKTQEFKEWEEENFKHSAILYNLFVDWRSGFLATDPAAALTIKQTEEQGLTLKPFISTMNKMVTNPNNTSFTLGFASSVVREFKSFLRYLQHS
jgi:hypothetical protein